MKRKRSLRCYAIMPAELGRPLTQKDLMDVVAMMVLKMPYPRRKKLPLKDGRPGHGFCRSFEARHSDTIAFRTQRKQDATRYNATNAEVLVGHFAKLECIVHENDIDAKRIINLDETEVSAWKPKGCGGRRAYSTRSHKLLTCGATFQNVNRITLLASVHGNGERGRPLFIMQGTKLRIRRYQHRLDPSREFVESIAECLPRGALVGMRKEVAAVDSENFKQWASAFIEDTEDLRPNNRKILLVYDGYRSHLSIPVLEMFRDAGIIAYALPAHTSGTTQPLDVGVFSPFKAKFNQLTDDMVKGMAPHHVFNEFDVCRMITAAYESTFTHFNIVAGFRKTGIVPLDECRLFGQARPYSRTEPYRIASVDEMIIMLDERRKKQASEILGDIVIQSQGFLDTTYGAVVTSDAAVAVLRLHMSIKSKKRKEVEAKDLLAQEQLRESKRQRHVAREQFEKYRAERRMVLFGEPPVKVRSLRVRAQAARERFQEEHEGRVKKLGLTCGDGS